MAQCEVKFNFVQWNEKISTCSQSSCQRFIHCGPPLLFSKMWDNKYPAVLTSEPQVVISYSYVMVCCIWWNFPQCKIRSSLTLQWNGRLVRHPARFSALFGLLQVMRLDSHCLMQCSWPLCELTAIETQWSKRGGKRWNCEADSWCFAGFKLSSNSIGHTNMNEQDSGFPASNGKSDSFLWITAFKQFQSELLIQLFFYIIVSLSDSSIRGTSPSFRITLS